MAVGIVFESDKKKAEIRKTLTKGMAARFAKEVVWNEKSGPFLIKRAYKDIDAFDAGITEKKNLKELFNKSLERSLESEKEKKRKEDERRRRLYAGRLSGSLPTTIS